MRCLGITAQASPAPSASVTPSAAVWSVLSADAPRDGERPARALVLADPWHPAEAGAPAVVRELLGSTTGLGPLPHARDEARGARRALGAGVDVLEGRDATESAVKAASLDDVGILHFAAHSLVDGEIPERSSVLLAPDGAEDGLLQAREVLDLRLPRTLVTLSACKSASGRAVAGEGVLGLSRAFFQAGASAVVGSLWPIRDEEAAALMQLFYERLGRGETPGAALAAAKRELAAAGAPPAAWAGVVLIGAGDGVRWTAQREMPWTTLGIVGGLVVLFVVGAALIRRSA